MIAVERPASLFQAPPIGYRKNKAHRYLLEDKYLCALTCYRYSLRCCEYKENIQTNIPNILPFLFCRQISPEIQVSPTSSKESREYRAPKHTDTLRDLKKGCSILNTAKLFNDGRSTVQRMKKEFC